MGTLFLRKEARLYEAKTAFSINGAETNEQLHV